MEEIPTFDKAVNQFKEFLGREEKPEEIQWLFCEDITTYKRKFWLKYPLPQNNWSIAEKLYQSGLDRGYGININQIGDLKGHSFCYLWLPEDELTMSQAMMNGNLKLSISQSKNDIRIIKSNIIFNLLKWLNKTRGFNFLGEEIPKRNLIKA